MRVVCVDNSINNWSQKLGIPATNWFSSRFTIGKEYTANKTSFSKLNILESTGYHNRRAYSMYDDYNILHIFVDDVRSKYDTALGSYFIPMQDLRDSRLNDLGI